MIISITNPDGNTFDIYLDKVALCTRNPTARVIKFCHANMDTTTHTFDTPEAYNSVVDQLQTYYRTKLLESMPRVYHYGINLESKENSETVQQLFSSRENAPSKYIDPDSWGKEPQPKPRDLSQGTGGL